MSNIGDRIRAARTARGWSQEELAQKAGVSQGTIGHLESGRNETSRKLVDIARVLGLTAEDLSVRTTRLPPQKEEKIPPEWPFEIEIERVLALPAEKRAKIEGFMQATVQEWESQHTKRKAG